MRLPVKVPEKRPERRRLKWRSKRLVSFRTINVERTSNWNDSKIQCSPVITSECQSFQDEFATQRQTHRRFLESCVERQRLDWQVLSMARLHSARSDWMSSRNSSPVNVQRTQFTAERDHWIKLAGWEDNKIRRSISTYGNDTTQIRPQRGTEHYGAG